MKDRLDKSLVQRHLAISRSQAENYIKLGQVRVNGKVTSKPGFLVSASDDIELTTQEQYVSRAALKLASVAQALQLDFRGKLVLDVGSSTGGFTDYALHHGAHKVIAVDVGTNQLHPRLRGHPQVELHEKTDIRDFTTTARPGMVIIDVSFISLKQILPTVARLSTPQTQIVAMVKPQFETGQTDIKHKGVIKNERLRRDILKDFEEWTTQRFIILDKADSQVSGAKGNQERFYLLRKT